MILGFKEADIQANAVSNIKTNGVVNKADYLQNFVHTKLNVARWPKKKKKQVSRLLHQLMILKKNKKMAFNSVNVDLHVIIKTINTHSFYKCSDTVIHTITVISSLGL